MIRRSIALLVLILGLIVPAAAHADFGLVPGKTSVVATNADGTVDIQASSHPFAYSVGFELNTDKSGPVDSVDGGQARNVVASLPPGFFGNPQAAPACSQQEFEGGDTRCPGDTQVGVVHALIPNIGTVVGPIYNVDPPPGFAAELGLKIQSFVVREFATVRSDKGYALEVVSPNIPLESLGINQTIWGRPADAAHDAERSCFSSSTQVHLQGCPSEDSVGLPFLTLPATCGAGPEITVEADSILAPGLFVRETAPSTDLVGNPAPLQGCESVPFTPAIAATPTSKLAENPSGLDFELRLPNKGLLNADATAVETEPEKTEVTLPEGVTVNPSAAEGLVACSSQQYAAETIDSAPGEGCPAASKLGSLIARSPLLAEPVEGSLYLAAPHDNPFDSLLALYMVARAPERGLLVKQAGEVEPDPETGQLVTTFDQLPPLPYSSFTLHFREGGRAPLATPPACGSYQTIGNLTPFSAPGQPVQVSSSFQVERGADGGACPGGGVPSLHPGLSAGTVNNAAGRYSAFNLRLTRSDSEQEFTHFSIKLPPGLVGKLAGVPFCSDADVAAAHAREHEGGGAEELAQPSCPAASQVGRTLVGAGVGGVLTYVPGKVYLAGPYNGSALSIVAITAAKVGPFDLGTVVIREALKVNPETAEVFVDATGSDPIPHIIAGIPVHARGIRVYVDRPEFTLNPTSCKRTSTASTVLGSGADFASESDDQPVTVTSPFQAADCASLGFKPKLSITLKGGTKRSDYPALKAVVTARPGDANVGQAQVTLPHSEFLENAHIRTICTRVQFHEGNVPGEKCPAASVYGYAKAVTPLLDEPLEGPVYLRSSSHSLPDMVAALNSGKINIDLVGRIDSAKGGRIRSTFESVPDAAVSTFILEMQGGKKGLLVNSVNLCRSTNRAVASFTGQNGRAYRFEPAVKALFCRGKGKGQGKTPKRRTAGRALALLRSIW